MLKRSATQYKNPRYEQYLLGKKNNLHYVQPSAIALLYSCGEENINELFWENISEPYRSILEDCYLVAEDRKYTKLNQITNNIKYDKLNYIKLGVQLHQVKYYQLYKESYNSFKDYCEQEIHYPVWRANKIIKASRVAIQLIKYGFRIIPQNEAQARPLVTLTEDELYEKWQEVLDTYPFHSITAKKIKKMIYGEKYAEKGTLKLPLKVLEEIEIKAIENGVSVEKLLIQVFRGEVTINKDGGMNNKDQEEENIEKINPQVMEKWQEDLKTISLNEDNEIDNFADSLAEEISNTVSDFKSIIKKCFFKTFLQPLLGEN
ncbi:hypothetical protein IQ215_10240 [Cyanobacterium stanieri LEGE 03274]|uniref:Uncharacterized protein n=1 Tax=Cyanobacterium stanieri LEGE 03274 TaxID=1828756 RepID=A0ABR9V6B4_9CHRO|nr:hypothetical protein [Cyanobacterium stanieri LEGE 03274]